MISELSAKVGDSILKPFRQRWYVTSVARFEPDEVHLLGIQIAQGHVGIGVRELDKCPTRIVRQAGRHGADSSRRPAVLSQPQACLPLALASAWLRLESKLAVNPKIRSKQKQRVKECHTASGHSARLREPSRVQRTASLAEPQTHNLKA